MGDRVCAISKKGVIEGIWKDYMCSASCIPAVTLGSPAIESELRSCPSVAQTELVRGSGHRRRGHVAWLFPPRRVGRSGQSIRLFGTSDGEKWGLRSGKTWLCFVVSLFRPVADACVASSAWTTKNGNMRPDDLTIWRSSLRAREAYKDLRKMKRPVSLDPTAGFQTWLLTRMRAHRCAGRRARNHIRNPTIAIEELSRNHFDSFVMMLEMLSFLQVFQSSLKFGGVVTIDRCYSWYFPGGTGEIASLSFKGP